MIPQGLFEKVRRIEIRTRGMAAGAVSGGWRSAFRGQGMEFQDVRPYAAGDDIRSIDWNVTARAHEPFVRRYREERELTVLLAVDASGSGLFGSTTRLKRDAVIEASALLAFSAIGNNDRVGLLVFTSETELFIPPRKGREHVLRLIRDLLCFEPKHRGTDIAAALSYLGRVQHRRAVVFLISDMLAQGYEKSFRLAARRHDLVSVRVTDPRESALPNAGLVELIDPETGGRIVADSSDRRLRAAFAAAAVSREDALKTLCRAAGVDTVTIDAGGDCVEPLAALFRKRELSGR